MRSKKLLLAAASAVILLMGTLNAALIETNISTAVGDGADVYFSLHDNHDAENWDNWDINYGDATDLVSAHYGVEAGFRSILRFDLAELEGLEIIDAQLHVYMTRSNASSAIAVYGLDPAYDVAYSGRPADGGWEEDSITPNSHSDFVDGGYGLAHGPFLFSGIGGGVGNWRTGTRRETEGELNIVTWLNEVLQGPGVGTMVTRVHGHNTVGTSHDFASKEYEDGQYAPYLSITAIPEPTSLLLLGIGGLLVLWRRPL